MDPGEASSRWLNADSGVPCRPRYCQRESGRAFPRPRVPSGSVLGALSSDHCRNVSVVAPTRIGSPSSSTRGVVITVRRIAVPFLLPRSSMLAWHAPTTMRMAAGDTRCVDPHGAWIAADGFSRRERERPVLPCQPAPEGARIRRRRRATVVVHSPDERVADGVRGSDEGRLCGVVGQRTADLLDEPSETRVRHAHAWPIRLAISLSGPLPDGAPPAAAENRTPWETGVTAAALPRAAGWRCRG